MMEAWKDISDYEGLYQVSNLGRIKALPRDRRNQHGSWVSPEKILSPGDSNGYPVVSLTKNKIVRGFLVHRVVAIHFIYNSADKREVNHIDGNKRNNILSNLEWCTPVENAKHAASIGLLRPRIGSQNGRSKLTESDIVKIINLYKSGHNQYEIMKIFGISQANVSIIVNRKTWSHLKIA